MWQWAYSALEETASTTAAKRFAGPETVPTTGTTTATPVTFNLRYPGQYADAESGLFYNYFRSYNPTTGRYTQTDPIGLDGGWNRFSYVGGNPLLFVDPRGLDIMVITGGRRDGSLNGFGHVGAAVQGAGMASYGNDTPLGSSVADYLNSQGAVRDQQVTVIPTSAIQDAMARAFIKQHPNMNGVGKWDNCAVRTSGLLNAAGVTDDVYHFPGATMREAQSLPGATTFSIPQNGPIPPRLQSVLEKFNR
jgi:RHS repeat-associated protein